MVPHHSIYLPAVHHSYSIYADTTGAGVCHYEMRSIVAGNAASVASKDIISFRFEPPTLLSIL
jgi:hypothetical protein